MYSHERGPPLGLKQTCAGKPRISPFDPEQTATRLRSPKSCLRCSHDIVGGLRMKRREFIAASAVLLVSPRLSLAQERRRQIGWLGLNELLPTWQNAWLDGLRNNGWIDGKNLIIEYRFGRSQD